MSRRRRSAGASALRDSVSVFAALGDETRLALVVKLSSGTPQSIVQLTDGHAVSRQAVTKHLRVLEGAGLVRGVRQGRESVFALETKALVSARVTLDRIAHRPWRRRARGGSSPDPAAMVVMVTLCACLRRAHWFPAGQSPAS